MNDGSGIQRGDIVEIETGDHVSPKYLQGLEAVVVKVNPVNYQIQLLRPELGRRYGDGAFNAAPGLIKFVRKGDGTVPEPSGNGDGDEQQDVRTTGFTLRDFKKGDKVRTAQWVRPQYIADQPGKVKKIRLTQILVEFDNPPTGRFDRGVVIAPERLYKVEK